MKDIYKNPILYYILIPVLVGLWPLLIWTVYLPNVKRSWNTDREQYNKAQKLMLEILTLDPDRLKFTDSNNSEAEFDYAIAIDRVATLCKIPPANYKLSSGIMITSGGQKSQSAKVDLRDIDIAKFARFLSTIQLRYSNLQCSRVKLTKKKALADLWDADIDFKYYY
jgi:hypothetical protein